MTTTTNVQQVKVNVVTQAQYDSMTKNKNEFYVIKDKSYVENDSASVISALGYTPYNSTNPNGYISGITSGMVTSALGYTPYNSTNPSGYISGITSSMVTSALGYTPYNSTNPSGYITGIDSSMVTSALGYTPYNSTNPNGYISGITSSMVTTALGFTPANASNVQTVQNISTLTPTTGTTVNYTVSNGTSLYSLTPTGNITTIGFTYTGTANKAYTFELMLTLSTPRTIGWNSNIHWLDGEVPDLSTTGVYFLAFRKVGQSSIWYGNLQGKWTP